MLINGYTFWEDSGDTKSPKYQFAADDSRVIRSAQLRSPEEIARPNAMQQLLGYNILVAPSQNAGKYISRFPPHAYPSAATGAVNQAGVPYMYATSVPSLEPIANVE